MAILPWLYCAQDDSGSADGVRTCWLRSSCLPQALAEHSTGREEQTLVNPREWARRSGSTLAFRRRVERWGHQRTRLDHKRRKPAGPRVLCLSSVQRAAVSGAYAVLAGERRKVSGEARPWGGNTVPYVTTSFVAVLTSTNCLGFRSSPSIRDRQDLASTRQGARPEEPPRIISSAGCSGCAARKLGGVSKRAPVLRRATRGRCMRTRPESQIRRGSALARRQKQSNASALILLRAIP